MKRGNFVIRYRTKGKLIISLAMLVSFLGFTQADTVHLTPPSGPYPVGTVTYEWTDLSRELSYTSHQGDKRTIVAQLWYPAAVDSTSVRAPYSPLSADYSKVKGNSYLRPSFSKSVKNANLIIFSPGRGTERFMYTTLIEDLASQGFVVASIDMPLIGYTLYGDGYVLKPSSEFRTPPGMMGGPYEKVDAFFEKPTAMGVRDLEFVYDQIMKLNKADPNKRFTGKINMEEIGIFGHSLGGRIAGRYTANNSFVKAYISMEGIPPRDVRYEGKISIPTAMLCSSGTLPYAVDNYNSYIDNRKNTVYFIVMGDFGHNSVTDNPFIYPDSFSYKIDPEIGLNISREIVSTYFKEQLKDSGNLEEDLNDVKQLEITKFDE
jgi:hypothetical protein